MPADFSQSQVSFSPETLQTLNLVLAFVMFGVAMSLRLRDFRAVANKPAGIGAGLLSQWVLLPALTVALIWILRPPPGLALGMVLVGCCPGGSVSNFLTFLSRGDTALSVSLTAFSSAGAVLVTPLSFAFWGSLAPGTAELLTEISVSPLDIGRTILIVLLIPLCLGILVAEKAPEVAKAVEKPARVFSFLFLLAFIIFTSVKYWEAFESYLFEAGWMVVLHNILALGLGFGVALLFRLPPAGRKTLAIETGIQNTGLGLLLIFTFFQGFGAMALVAAWYGVWHIASGLLLSAFWARRVEVSPEPRDVQVL